MQKNVYFWQNIYKMATKQYLDAQAIPYQVILREANGSYSDQYPQSFYVSREGNGFRANGGTGDHFLKRDFSAIDWGACFPVPDPIPTDIEGYMAYLSTYFTGQATAPIPATPQSMYIWTTPLLAIEVRDTIPLFIPFSGGSGIPAEDGINNYIAGFSATLNEVCVTTTTATLDDTVLVELLQNKAIIADTTIAVGGVASAQLFSIYADLVQDEPLYYKITSSSATGEISLSFRAKVTLPS